MQDLTDREPQYTKLQICENLIASVRFDWRHKAITEDQMKCRIDEICDQLQQIKQVL